MAYDTLDEMLECMHGVTGLAVSSKNCKYRGADSGGHGPAPGFAFCRLIHSCDKAITACKESDLSAFQTAAQRGEIYSYTCPFGLLEAVMPIFNEGQPAGYVMIGKGISAEPGTEERILEHVLNRFPELEKKREELAGCLAAMTHLSGAQWDCCLCTLYVYAKFIEEQRLLLQQPKSLGQMARAYINANYGNKITLTDLCVQLHCSTVTLTQHFRKEFGTSISCYLKDKRLAHAKYLLRNTQMSINEVSEACGFSEANYFFRQFKSKYGVSPTLYRKRHKEEKKSEFPK